MACYLVWTSFCKTSETNNPACTSKNNQPLDLGSTGWQMSIWKLIVCTWQLHGQMFYLYTEKTEALFWKCDLLNLLMVLLRMVYYLTWHWTWEPKMFFESKKWFDDGKMARNIQQMKQHLPNEMFHVSCLGLFSSSFQTLDWVQHYIHRCCLTCKIFGRWPYLNHGNN